MRKCVNCFNNEAALGWNRCLLCIWEYSRNQHRHWIDNGKMYGNEHYQLWVIKDCRTYGSYHKRADGYDLFFKGKKIAHGITVKELKEIVRKRIVPTKKGVDK